MPTAEPVRGDSQGDDFGSDVDDFGAGIVEDTTERAGTIVSRRGTDTSDVAEDIEAEAFEVDPAAAAELIESVEATEATEAEGEVKPKRKRTSTARGKGKKAAGDEGEAKPKRRRSTKKKGEEGSSAEEGTANDEGDDKPKYQGSAERRTTDDDDGFFFDPMAPNDRFSGGTGSESGPGKGHRDEEREQEPVDENPEFEAEPSEETQEEAAEPGIDNNFAELTGHPHPG